MVHDSIYNGEDSIDKILLLTNITALTAGGGKRTAAFGLGTFLLVFTCLV